MNKKWNILAAAALCASLLLTACGGRTAQEGGETEDVPAASQQTQPADTGATSDDGADYSFSKRDLDASYDAVTAHITLADGASTVDGDGATAEGDTVTVTAAGTYVITGSLTNGSVVVAAGSAMNCWEFATTSASG